MDRRSFFKVCAGVGAAAVLPVSLVEAVASVPQGKEQVGLIREVFAYDINWDLFILRYDILTDGEQFGVDVRASKAEVEDPKRLAHLREVSVEVLGNHLKHIGKTWKDIKYMPLPESGAMKASYLHA